ncbi:MAG: peptide transporter [Phycisphaeraceae bacterium]|nr:peptide transporter [Phycisphaeraceae bacterium]
MREDQEFREFRDLMKRPDRFDDGVNWGTIIMALFVGLLMTPAQLYMQLVAGIEMGSAAQWVTVILYVEVARRAMARLRRPEIFVLFYMCGAVIHSGGGLLWNQFLVQSEEMRKLGITEHIPAWFAPSDPDVLGQRSFFMKAWLVPIGLMILTLLVSRLDHFGLGYVMFRLTSDVEKLPFPMAPVGAMGMTALADAAGQRESWQWRVFSMGGAGGLAFGVVYLALPNVTGAIFATSLEIIPLPFVDLTAYTEQTLPTMPMMVSLDLSFIVMGMVLPFWAMVGAFIGLLFTMALNPLLYHFGLLHSWEPGLGAIRTIQANTMDFYFSFGLGLSVAVAVIGLLHLLRGFLRSRRGSAAGGGPLQWRNLLRPPAGRGDFSIWLGLLIYVGSTTTYIALTYYLVNVVAGIPPGGRPFPLWLLIFYGFVYTPFISYVSARMEGIVGQQVTIPFVREATFILSGYKGAAIWFAPIPLHNYSQQVQFFRTTELTGTKFTSLIKAELIIFPIMAVGSILFAQFIWSIAEVPSALFPYANEFWELRAYQQGLLYSSTLPGEQLSPFQEAFDWQYIAAGLGLSLLVYGVLNHFGLPIFLVYGVVRGLDQSAPHAIVPMFIGALLGRYVLRKRYGENWARYRIVFAAGFTAGMGLIAMFSFGLVLMSKSAVKLPF